MSYGKAVVAFIIDRIGEVPIYVSKWNPLPVILSTITGKGTRTLRVSIPIANLNADETHGAGLIQLDNKATINPGNVGDYDGKTIREIIGNDTAFQVMEITCQKNNQNPIWNETFRVYRFNGTDFLMVGDAISGLQLWTGDSTEENNQLSNNSLWVDFVNQIIQIAQINVKISY